MHTGFGACGRGFCSWFLELLQVLVLYNMRGDGQEERPRWIKPQFQWGGREQPKDRIHRKSTGSTRIHQDPPQKNHGSTASEAGKLFPKGARDVTIRGVLVLDLGMSVLVLEFEEHKPG